MNQESNDWIKAKLGVNKLLDVEQVRSGQYNQVYRIVTENDTYYLKHGSELIGERDRLLWLRNKLPVPELIDWRLCANGEQELLMLAIEGTDLAKIAKHIPRTVLVDRLIEALRLIHSVDIADCPFGEKQPGFVFTHGDACPPNFIVNKTELVGIIDVDKAGIADPQVDIAAVVWGLAYNCGPGADLDFLRAYGYPSATEQDAIHLIKQFEPDWSGY